MRITLWRKKNKRYFFVMLLYILALNYLMIHCYNYLFLSVYINPFGNDYGLNKNIIGIVLAGFIGMHMINQLGNKTISSDMVGIIEILYFIPGIIYCSITGTTWMFIIYFFLFWLLIAIFQSIIPRAKGTLSKYLRFSISERGYLIATILVICSSFLLGHLSGGNFANIIFDSKLVYANRAEMAERSIHWIIWNAVIAFAYLLPILFCYSARRRQWGLTVLIVLAELYLYSIGSNRIFIFLLGMALVFSVIGGEQKWCLILQTSFTLISILGFYIAPHFFQIIPGIIDRLGTIPTRVAIRYYVYFSDHTPGMLTDAFPRLINFLHISSPYTTKGIGVFVGDFFSFLSTSVGFDNENTGLVGGAIGNFGLASILIAPLVYVIAFRIIESACNRIDDKSIRTLIALTFAILAINGNQFLTTFIRYTANSILLLLILVFFNRGGKKCSTDSPKKVGGAEI